MISIDQILIKVKELEAVFVILGADEKASLNSKFDQIAKENGLENIEKDIRFIATIRNAIVHDGDTFKIDKRVDEGFRRCYNNVKKALNWQGDLKLVNVDKTKNSVVSTKELLKMTSEIESLLETLGAKEEQGSGLVQKFKTIRVAYDLEFLRPQMDKIVEIRNDCVHKVGEFALSQSEFDAFKITHATLKQELLNAISRGVKSDDEIKRMTLIKSKLNKSAKYPKQQREIRAYDRPVRKRHNKRQDSLGMQIKPVHVVIGVVLLLLFLYFKIKSY